jgi:hypothetical protein
MRNAPRARLALALGAATTIAWVLHLRAARAEDDQAAADYAGRVKAVALEHAADLERATRDAHEKNPCARGDVTLSLLVKPDGAVVEASADPTPQLPDEFLDAVATAAKAWKLPPTGRPLPGRVRVPLGALPTAPPAPALGCDAELLDRGAYNVTELVPGIERGKWWAVCKPSGDTGGDVRGVKLRLKRFRSDAAGDEKNEMTGREVVVSGCDAPAFLFRNLASAKEGRLVSAKVTAKIDAWDGTADITLGAASYHLSLEAKAPRGAGTTERPWKILLSHDGASEELDSGHTTLAPLLRVRWAGDLDGDGRADFVLEDHSDGTSLQLFLSGAALGRHNVRRVATTSWGGR